MDKDEEEEEYVYPADREGPGSLKGDLSKGERNVALESES